MHQNLLSTGYKVRILKIDFTASKGGWSEFQLEFRETVNASTGFGEHQNILAFQYFYQDAFKKSFGTVENSIYYFLLRVGDCSPSSSKGIEHI